MVVLDTPSPHSIYFPKTHSILEFQWAVLFPCFILQLSK